MNNVQQETPPGGRPLSQAVLVVSESHRPSKPIGVKITD